MVDNKMNLWTLFFSHFKINDDVVLIDNYDKMIVGKLVSVDPKGCTIKRWGEGGAEYYYYFVHIRFMSHDGFPVKKLSGADGSWLIEEMKSVDPTDMLKEAMTKEKCPKCKRCLVEIGMKKKATQPCWDCERKECWTQDNEKRKKGEIVFGDPFQIHGVDVKVFNSGNRDKQWHDSLFEEVLVLTAKDGACAELYDFNSIYHFDWR